MSILKYFFNHYINNISEELRQSEISETDENISEIKELQNDLETCKKVINSADYYLNTGKLYYPDFCD